MSTIISVEGMTCGHCEQTVEEALQGVSGVTDASVDRGATGDGRRYCRRHGTRSGGGRGGIHRERLQNCTH